MKKALLTLMLALPLFTANAQLADTDKLKKSLELDNKDTVAWLHGGVANIGLNQGFLHNWAAGGELGSLTVNGLFSGYLIRLNNKHVWSNNLDMTYGLFYAYSNSFIPRKIDDRIDLTSKYGYRISEEHFYLTGLFNFKSQFTKGYDYSVPGWDTFSTSKFLSPAYLTLAAGIEYRKGTNLTLFLSPAAARFTFADRYYTTRAPEGAFGIEFGETSRFELGAYFSGRYLVNITPNMVFKTRLDLYSNYIAKDKTDALGNVIKKDSPGNIDILFDNLFSWKVSKYANFIIGATFIYDNDIPYQPTYMENGVEVAKNDPGEGLGWLQVKQIFTLGFEYKF